MSHVCGFNAYLESKSLLLIQNPGIKVEGIFSPGLSSEYEEGK